MNEKKIVPIILFSDKRLASFARGARRNAQVFGYRGREIYPL